MKEELVSFKIAELAKEKGFNEETTWGYVSKKLTHRDYIPHNFNIRGLLSVPTQSFLQKWLREVHKIDVDIFAIFPLNELELNHWEVFGIFDLNTGKKLNEGMSTQYNEYKTYEKALKAGLYEALKLIK